MQSGFQTSPKRVLFAEIDLKTRGGDIECGKKGAVASAIALCKMVMQSKSG
jgi:hypothetical protein